MKETVAAAVGAQAVTEDLKEMFRKVVDHGNHNVVVIRTCVSDTWSSIVRKPDRGMLLAVGRLHWRKGFADLLVAAAGVKRRGLSFKLVIVGEGPERSRLSYMIHDLGLDDCVQLKGRLEHGDLVSYMEQASWFVLSSIQEGFPNVLAEALSARVPVITTRLPGVLEVLNERDTALVADVAVPESLEAAMVEALSMSSHRAEAIAQAAFNISRSLIAGEAHAAQFQSFWQKSLAANDAVESA